MVGVGGGVFMVPLLTLGNLVATTQEAAGTSIAAVIFTSLSSSVAYWRKGHINLRLGLSVMPGALAGGWLGAFLTPYLASEWLAVGFGIFLLYPAGRMLLGREPKEAPRGGRTTIPRALGVGLLAGTVSGLFGVGGGTVMVPALSLVLGLDVLAAVATSLFVMAPSAALATFQHALQGHTHWELAIPLILGIMAGAQVGPRASTRMPKRRLGQLFSLVLLYAAVNMVLAGLGLR